VKSPKVGTSVARRVVVSLKAWRILLALAMLGIFVLSVLPPSPHLPSTGWDKSNHMLGFGTLGLLGTRGWPGRTWAVIAALLAYGGLIEVLQSLTPDRSAEWADLLADGIGLGVGWLLAQISLLFIPRSGDL
jgi:VanZ family protein